MNRFTVDLFNTTDGEVPPTHHPYPRVGDG